MSNGASTPTEPSGSPGPGGQWAHAHTVDVQLCLPASAPNVALVRQALAGLVDELGVAPARAADMKIAITEACTNAVVHAYGAETGSLEVTMSRERGRLVLSVRDRGYGLQQLAAEREGPPLGFGLALIASLADEFGIAGGREGTEVRMSFALGDRAAHPPLIVQLSPREPPPAGIVLTLGPGNHAAAVLGRVVSLVAARADFSIDRLSDAQIVSDAIASSAAPHLLDGTLRVAIDEHAGGFELALGPLARGGGRGLVEATELPGLGCLLRRLTDEISVEAGPEQTEGELLRLRLGVRS